MKRILLSFLAALAGLLAIVARAADSLLMGPPTYRRVVTHDVAFGFRMGAGFPGDVNRMHPASIVAGMMDTTIPLRGYGHVAIFGDGTNGAANTYRGTLAADGSATPLNIAGLIVRPYPTQQMSGTSLNASFGNTAPPGAGAADFLESGFMIVKGRAGMNVRKGGAVHVWVANTSGASIRDEFQAAASSTNTITIANAMYWGPADADGNVEIRVWSAR